MVSTTSTAGFFSVLCMSTGMPRPSSMTVIELSTWMMTSMCLQKPAKRLVDRVVDDFVHEVMQTAFAGVADVHRGPFAHRLDAFEFLNFVGGIISRAEWRDCV